VLWEPISAIELPERVAIVADGPLLGLPWAALPCGAQSGELLIDNHEFVILPSLAAWRVAVDLAQAEQPGDIETLVVVDPIYGSDDARMGGKEIASLPVEPLPMRGANFVRLPGSQSEANLIERLHGQKRLMVLAGFTATRDAVLARLPTVRSTIHFGTHGIAGSNALAESGLVLSLVDRDGLRRDGFLSAGTIAGLRVTARLVVLAACDSAEGVIVTGESALGVSYAFSLAGARQVLGAMWPVSDAATSALMQAFYTAVYQEHRSPSEALRGAQLSVRATRRFRDPRHWSAFQLSGGPEG
jgi:CHAT domain-containing protein